MSRAELQRKQKKMQEQRCYKHCNSCGGCANFTSNMQKCVNCAPECNQCRCAFGKRIWLGADGFIKVKEFGYHSADGRRIDLGPVISVRQVCPPEGA